MLDAEIYKISFNKMKQKTSAWKLKILREFERKKKLFQYISIFDELLLIIFCTQKKLHDSIFIEGLVLSEENWMKSFCKPNLFVAYIIVVKNYAFSIYEFKSFFFERQIPFIQLSTVHYSIDHWISQKAQKIHCLCSYTVKNKYFFLVKTCSASWSYKWSYMWVNCN